MMGFFYVQGLNFHIFKTINKYGNPIRFDLSKVRTLRFDFK